jgi:BirA family biotin operon repressor/biotin-[acetyl-CoA-carboxylase] ligase
MFFGNEIFRLDRVDSTNNFAANLISSQLCQNGTAILAEEQTAGRGQRDQVWESESNRNLLCSYILLPDNVSVDQLPYYNWMLSLALLETLQFFNVDAKIKWPNDIFVNGKKICGVLLENQISDGHIKSMILGVGLNVNQTEFKIDSATSLKLETQIDFEIEKVFKVLNEGLNKWMLILLSHPAVIKEQYLKSLYLLNTNAKFKIGGKVIIGSVKSVNHLGQLVLSIDGEEKLFNHKEIEFMHS